MRRALVLLGLVALVAADLEVKPIQEDTSVPGVASSTYAIVQDGRVVGMVEHYRSQGSLGRRFGPPSDQDSRVAELLAQLWSSQADALAGLRDRLLAAPSRCPFARQMALARMQAAAAAAAEQPQGEHVLEHPALPSFTKPMFGPGMLVPGNARADPRSAAAGPMRRLPASGAAASNPAQPQAADAQPAFERPPLFGRGGRPLIPLHRPAAASDEPAWPRPGAAAEEEPAWARDGPAEEEPAGVMPLLGMLWSRVAREPMPRVDVPEGPHWRLWGADGSFNWSLATFIALTVACSAVWGALLVQWAAFCRARANQSAAAFFITRVASDEAAALKPLLHEGPVKGCVVEDASAHVAGAQSVKVLSYEPLKGSDNDEH
ncbi:hypothetical protein ABPG77_010063 [Micractinium sp. CCAP 211/92]